MLSAIFVALLTEDFPWPHFTHYLPQEGTILCIRVIWLLLLASSFNPDPWSDSFLFPNGLSQTSTFKQNPDQTVLETGWPFWTYFQDFRKKVDLLNCNRLIWSINKLVRLSIPSQKWDCTFKNMPPVGWEWRWELDSLFFILYSPLLTPSDTTPNISQRGVAISDVSRPI